MKTKNYRIKNNCRNTSHRNTVRRSGFTLVEVMVVLFILLSIAAIAVVNVLGARERANVESTKGYVKALASALELYSVHVGRFPTAEQGLNALMDAPGDLPDPSKWSGPYLKDSAQTVDPWGSPFQYTSPGQRSRDGFDVWSFGPDGTDGTEDDIGNWSK
ncbi:type II secretion system protein GspG [Planctomycetales bacterium]|nr:type II secretion system protein GspG [Planctomycetales bacterium]GHT36945.1 type II secretion system protein GspG [Planctomycetales bacterium]